MKDRWFFQIKQLYSEYQNFFTEIKKDPDFDEEHVEPDGQKYELLSPMEKQTVRNMVFLGIPLGELKEI